jgi:drug/metabolite transporter (DMT)-like permease
MTGTAVALAFASSFCYGAGLVLTQFGLRSVPPLPGAAISVPTATVMLLCIGMATLYGQPIVWAAVPVFVAVGLLFPGAVTLVTFEANRVLGPVITGTLGNLAPLFAVTLAFVVLGEPLRPAQLGGLAVIMAGVAILTTGRGTSAGHWRSWYLLLPLLGAAVRGAVQPAMKVGLEIWPSPFAATLVSYAVSALVVLAATRWRTGLFMTRAPLTGRLWFVGVGLCNGLAVLLLYGALTNGPVTLVSPIVATYPLVTVTLGALVLGRPDGTLRLVAAVVMTVAGVALLLVG